jgi:hypothetical protein
LDPLPNIEIHSPWGIPQMMEEFLQIPQMMEEFLHQFLHDGGIPPSMEEFLHRWRNSSIREEFLHLMEEFLWVISGHYDRGGLLNTPPCMSFTSEKEINLIRAIALELIT